ncbi:unnamed protein product [Bursaphelenchus xylophilus]|uniref:Carbonic anhydrase n=1 Tax=Bursaphelenchus xylophilus TaxID=6326 RepID=A0A1I7SKZ4_BURXY|nr:unnamed protein product [Bursaphelenchus xylophilus]CAG9129309.1 unnamed protein product [Bursaphelenchus xylophilus]
MDLWSRRHGENEGNYDGFAGVIGNYDPTSWPGLCRNGRSQSPIDLASESTTYRWIEPLQFVNFDADGPLTLVNTGWSIELQGFLSWTNRPIIYGGNLNTAYNLVNIHFHWGQNTSHGSEHSVNGLNYAAEMHFVFSKTGKTPERNDTRRTTTDLHVLSILLKVNTKRGVLSSLEGSLAEIVENGRSNAISNITPYHFLPNNLDHFYRYTGSLTTPPCTEGVVWTVMATPVDISVRQLNLLRQIHSTDETPFIPGNFRNTQKLNSREVLFKI